MPPPAGAPVGERLRALHRRHLLREQRAKDVYAESRSPERGWPVADNDAVFAFFRRLVRRRRGAFAAMVVLNGLAAAAALLIPRLLGDLIDRTVSGDTSASGVTSLALVILAVVVAQSLFTFLGQRTSTLFGQDLLASAREYIIDTILRLPLGRVEGASTGDLVTRVTRDVGTMSRSVQYGVPMAIISRADREPLDRRDAAELGAARGAGAAAHRLVDVPGAALPRARPEVLHHRGRDVLPDQHDAHRDRRGRPHRRGARPDRDARRGRRRRHRAVGAGRALRHDAAQPALQRHRRGVQRAAGASRCWSAPTATRRAG